jgi:hypothetical protein
MDNLRRLRGTELRYVLTIHLFDHGPATVNDLVDALCARGFRVSGRASKSVSDALRWEIGHDRVRRLGRGRYGPGWMPRSTEHRIHQRVLALREEVLRLSLIGGHDQMSQAS